MPLTYLAVGRNHFMPIFEKFVFNKGVRKNASSIHQDVDTAKFRENISDLLNNL